MPLKAMFFPLGCILAWFVFLPLLVIGGGLALFAYAIVAELGAHLTGNPDKSLDTSATREIARRLCAGYGVAADRRRQSSPMR